MQDGIEKTIDLIRIYRCGYCINDLGIIYKEKKMFSKDKFYANCILIHHIKYGYILVDTGYNIDIKNRSFKHVAYNLLNPTHVSSDNVITSQLKADGIDVNDINYVVISHFHPDHIGELRKFSNAKIVTSNALLERSMKELLTFKEYIPKDIYARLVDLDSIEKIDKTFIPLFEGSILFFELDGHVKGQICFIIPSNKILFIADSCWRINEIFGKYHITAVTKLIHSNIYDYVKSQKKIKKFLDNNPNYTVICSHDDKYKIGG